MWLEKLLDLRGDLSQVLIQPQFCVWLSQTMIEELAAEEENDGVVESSDDEDDDNGDNLAANASNISDVFTLHAPHAHMRLVDLAILFILPGHAVMSSPSPLDGMYSTSHISKVIVPVLLELKRAPSRNLGDEMLDKVLRTKVRLAKVQVMEQAEYLFTSSIYGPHQSQVSLIAAAGPYFSVTTVSADRLLLRSGLRKLQADEGWSTIMKVTSVAGENGLGAIRLALLDLAKKHPLPVSSSYFYECRT
jgi:hypothetical protein